MLCVCVFVCVVRDTVCSKCGVSFCSVYSPQATEEHDSSMTTMVTVEIIVVDVNDNGPMFDSTQYNDSISELADPGSLVATLEARDMDVVRVKKCMTHNLLRAI